MVLCDLFHSMLFRSRRSFSTGTEERTRKNVLFIFLFSINQAKQEQSANEHEYGPPTFSIPCHYRGHLRVCLRKCRLKGHSRKWWVSPSEERGIGKYALYTSACHCQACRFSTWIVQYKNIENVLNKSFGKVPVLCLRGNVVCGIFNFATDQLKSKSIS